MPLSNRGVTDPLLLARSAQGGIALLALAIVVIQRTTGLQRARAGAVPVAQPLVRP
ncbi:hypothetical protein ACIQGZ_12170 [Streptomyces sp. NPDC092296]|uniref:hypothetical protein n=1 Tax=Streptomyces sp. NPDC092296 TaxID=3366012 RepID=UPI0038281EE0